MQTFNLTTLSNDELDKFASKILELKRVSFQHVKKSVKLHRRKLSFCNVKLLIDNNNNIVTIVIVTIVSRIW